MTDGAPPAPSLRLRVAEEILGVGRIYARVVVGPRAHQVRVREPQVHVHGAPAEREDVDLVAQLQRQLREERTGSYGGAGVRDGEVERVGRERVQGF